MGTMQLLYAIRTSQTAYEARERERLARRDGASDDRLTTLHTTLTDALEAKAAAHSALTPAECQRMGMVSVQLLRGS